MRFVNFFWLVFIISLTFGGCHPDRNESEKSTNRNRFFPIKIGGKTLYLQLALNDFERARGLMFRDKIAENHGMLFLFEKPGQRRFWMRHTKIPLDLAYFDTTGKLLELHKLYPYDETPVASRSQEVLIAIKTARGWFAANAIGPKAQIELEALLSALRTRKVSTERYQINFGN